MDFILSILDQIERKMEKSVYFSLLKILNSKVRAPTSVIRILLLLAPGLRKQNAF